jgi:integrase
MWQEYHSQKVQYKAAEVYRAPLRRAQEHFGDTLAKDITPAQINAFIVSIADRGYAKRTVQVHLNMLNMIFDFAIVQPGSPVTINPCTAVRIPSGLSQKRRLPPSDEQLTKITPDAEFGLFAFFLMYTGLRRGELLALRWEDIDRENKLIYVNKSLSYENNKPVIKSTKTEAGNRVVDLLDVLDAVLPHETTGYVFGGDEPLTNIMFRKRWEAFCRDVGLAEKIEESHTAANKHVYTTTTWKPLVTPHQFRHAYASMLDDAGIDESTAKVLLGHSSIVVTKDIYTHLREAKKSRAGTALNEYLKK